MVTLEIRNLEKSRSRLFIVKGREDLLKLTSIALIIVEFFLLAAS